jgi:Ca-activated chloride channel family protein
MNKLTLLSRALVLSATITTVLAGCSTNTPEETAKNNKAGEQTAQTKAKNVTTEQVNKEPLKQQVNSNEAKTQQSQTVSNVKPSTAVIDQTQMANQDEYQAGQATVRSESIAVDGARISSMTKMKRSLTYAPGAPSPQNLHYREQPNSENYAQGKINPVYNTNQNPVSTFSVDVDTASYANVRRLLNQGLWPDKGAVRVEEMINYFNYNYPAPQTTEQPFAVHTEVAASPWNPGTHLMRIALKGYQTSKENLPPMNLVFLFDVSGSMNNANKLPLLKQAFSLLTKQLRPQDHVSMVVYAGASGLVLEPTKGDQQNDILAALDKLAAGGSTNGGAGIELAYKTAEQHFTKGGINRVILATDGDFNVGTTNMDKLKTLVEKKKQSGVFLSILGFGQGNYNDHLMEELSNIGNGTAYYVDSFKEARKVFSDGLTGTLLTIAKDVKIQVEFNPAYVSEYRLIGYDNRQLKREDFNNDKVDAGDIGADHTVTAFYEIVMTGSNYHFSDPLRYKRSSNENSKTANARKTPAKNDELAFVKLRYKKPDEDKSQLVRLPILASSINSDFAQASEEFKFATAVAAFGEKLRGSQYVDWSIEQIKQTATANLGKDTWGYRHEFVQLTLNAQAIEPKGWRRN